MRTVPSAPSGRRVTVPTRRGVSACEDWDEPYSLWEGSGTVSRNRLAIRYAVEGDLRFISHHDTLRLFERALARAAIPVKYSQGFNPRPRVRIALPRPVGVASLDELLLVELTSEPPTAEVLAELSKQVPSGITLLGADWIADDDRRAPREACYSLTIDPSLSETVAGCAARFLSAASVPVDRVLPGAHAARTVDIRQFVSDVQVTLNHLSWRQTIAQEGTARVGEVLDALGLPNRDHLSRLVRQSVCYEPR